MKQREILRMKKLFLVTLFFSAVVGAGASAAPSCGPGYVMVSRSDIDGIKAAECQKLWCRDLETGKSMGNGTKPATGYVNTAGPIELCDANRNCVECFGDRKWCSGAERGEWNPEYGAYTRGGDNATFESYLRTAGGCFTWQLEKPNCEDGNVAVLKNGEWVCATITSSGKGATINKASSVRRTGTIRRLGR